MRMGKIWAFFFTIVIQKREEKCDLSVKKRKNAHCAHFFHFLRRNRIYPRVFRIEIQKQDLEGTLQDLFQSVKGHFKTFCKGPNVIVILQSHVHVQHFSTLHATSLP